MMMLQKPCAVWRRGGPGTPAPLAKPGGSSSHRCCAPLRVLAVARPQRGKDASSSSSSSSSGSAGASLRAVRAKAAEAPATAPPPPTPRNTSPLFLSQEEEDAEGDCNVYMDRDGHIVEAMCCDYGYRSGVERMYQGTDGTIPQSGMTLALKHFGEELEELRRSFREDAYAQVAVLNPPSNVVWSGVYALGGLAVKALASLDRALEGVRLLPALETPKPDPLTTDDNGRVRPDCFELRSKLLQLKLSNDAVWRREHDREAATGGVRSPWFVKTVYLVLCVFLDVCFNNRPIARFWFLETVARMPYFSYISCLHLYESLGWWRAAAELRKVHFAEEWNELHHLQVMESLGGDRMWVDRFLGYHSAVVYYFILVAIFIASPQLAYNFSELIESHAIDTYGEFCDANEELLKSMPPPLVALQYYRGGDVYMFDEFQTSRRAEPRTPQCDNLYDVFINIRDDEGEHVKTMKACQDLSVVDELAERKEKPRRV